jgi:hypothetical protein
VDHLRDLLLAAVLHVELPAHPSTAGMHVRVATGKTVVRFWGRECLSHGGCCSGTQVHGEFSLKPSFFKLLLHCFLSLLVTCLASCSSGYAFGCVWDIEMLGTLGMLMGCWYDRQL